MNGCEDQKTTEPVGVMEDNVNYSMCPKENLYS